MAMATKRMMKTDGNTMSTATKRAMANNGDNRGNGYGDEAGMQAMAATMAMRMGTAQRTWLLTPLSGSNGPWFVCVFVVEGCHYFAHSAHAQDSNGTFWVNLEEPGQGGQPT